MTQAALGSETGNIYKGLLYSVWLSGWWCHCSEHPVWNTKLFSSFTFSIKLLSFSNKKNPLWSGTKNEVSE